MATVLLGVQFLGVVTMLTVALYTLNDKRK
jgi:hypothetical protein